MKLRVLFVDDEQLLIDGLKRSLRSQRKNWQMAFTTSGQEALALAAENDFDIIVSDMRMPGMSGADLLEKIAEQYPEMIRIILSGQASEQLTQQALSFTHQFLAKPCDAETIIETLNRAYALKQLVTDSRLQSIISKIQTLPTLPQLYLELTQLLENEDATVRQVGALVSQDPVMSAKLLQMVNSAFFGIGRQVSDPAQAASLLGVELIKGLVLTTGIFTQFDISKLGIGDFSLEALHQHSLLTATLAKQIAQHQECDKEIQEHCFLAGMLHDIGKLVVVFNLPEQYQAFHRHLSETDLSAIGAEHAIFGTDHGRIGAYLLGLWGLPEAVIEAIAFHHTPGLAGNPAFSALTAVHCADVLAAMSQSNAAVIPSKVDETYLESVACLDKLPQWQAMADQLIEKGVKSDTSTA